MIYFCGMVDWHKTLSFFFCWDDCQRFSPLQISNMLQAGFEPAQNLNVGFVEWSCARVITKIPVVKSCIWNYKESLNYQYTKNSSLNFFKKMLQAKLR